MIFWQKLKREGVTKHIVKNKGTLFCMIYYSIWHNQGTLCHSDCTPDPQKVIRIIDNVNAKPKMAWFLSKILGEGGQHAQNFVKNKFAKNRVGGREVNLNLDNVFKYTGFFMAPLNLMVWYFKIPTSKFSLEDTARIWSGHQESRCGKVIAEIIIKWNYTHCF